MSDQDAVRHLRLLRGLRDNRTEPRKSETVSTCSVGDLLETEYPELQFFVRGILPEGLTLLVSPSKVGKSFFAGSVAVAISSGGYALGYLPTSSAGVLFLDLEQSPVIAQRRWRALLGKEPAPPALEVSFDWPRVGEGFFSNLSRVLDVKPAIRVVIVDVFSRIYPLNSKRTSANAYHVEYELLSRLKQFADSRRISLLVIHHTNRTKTGDPLDEISGTNAMSGAPDAVWILKRERGHTIGKLYVTGRSVSEWEASLGWDPYAGGWILASGADIPPPTP